MDNNSTDMSSKGLKNRLQFTNLRKKLLLRAVLCLSVLLNTMALYGQTDLVVRGVTSGQTVLSSCAPVTAYLDYSCRFTTAHLASRYRIYVFWRDNPSNLNEVQRIDVVPTVGAGGLYTLSVSDLQHTFPRNGDCEYEVLAYALYWDGSAYVRILDSQQTQVIANWHEDDDADGFITLTPDIEEVCEGSPLLNFTFQDMSRYSCNIQNNPNAQHPNHEGRWQQYVYGTHASIVQGIPNLYIINENGYRIDLTDADGNPTVDCPYYGPIQSIAVNSETGEYDLPPSLPISFDGVGTVAGDYFEVTVRNWNTCNPYPSGVPNEDQARIVIIDAPPAPRISDRVICYGGTRTLTVASGYNPEGTLYWYSDAALTHRVATGRSYTPTQTAAGRYTFWVVDQQTNGNRCASPATPVTLTIRESISAPGTITGPSPVCVNATTVNYSVPAASMNATYGGPIEFYWTVPTGWTIISGQGTRSITVNIGGSSGSQTLSVVRRYTTEPYCTSSQRTRTITVTPLASGGSISGVSSICVGASLGNLRLSNNVGNVVRWERSGNNGATWTNINSTSTTLTGQTLPSAGTWQYRALVDNGCSQAYSSIYRVTAIAGPVGGTTSGGAGEICRGSSIGTIRVSGYEGYIVRWQRSNNNGSTWTNISSTSVNFTETQNTAGTWLYRAVIGRSPCEDTYSSATQVIVDPTTVGGTAYVNNTSTTTTSVCQGSSATILISGNVGNILYWERREATGPWTRYDAAGTNTSFVETFVVPGTYRYRARVQSGVCAAAYSSTATVVVNQTPSATITGDATVCYGSSSTISINNGYVGTIYRWQSRSSSNNGASWSSWSDLSSSNGRTTWTHPANSSVGIYEYRVVMRNNPCPEVNSNVVRVVVNPTSEADTISGVTHEICIGSSTGLMSVNSSAITGTVLGWQRRLGSGAWSSYIPGTAGQLSYSEVPSSAGTWQYRIGVQSGVCDPDYATYTITVYPQSVGGAVSAGINRICFSELPTSSALFTLRGHTGNVVRWQRQLNGTAAGGWTNVASTSATYAISNVPQTSGTWYYRAVVQNGPCDEVFSTPASVVVYPQFNSANIGLSANSVCNNETVDITVTVVGGVAPYTLTYNIYKDGALVNTNLTETFSTSSHTWQSGTLTSTTTTTGYAFRIVNVVDGNGCSVENIGPNANVVVGTVPTAATVSLSDDICSGGQATMVISITGGAAPYTITYTVSDGVSSTTDNFTITGNTATHSLGALSSNGSMPRTYTYSIVSITDDCGNNVPAGNISWNPDHEIVVNPIPDITATTMDTDVICNGGTAQFTLRTDVNGTNFSWTTSVSPAGVTVNGLNSSSRTNVNGSAVVTETLSHLHNAPVTVTYTITSVGSASTNCVGNTITRSVVVNPVPTMRPVNDQVICNNTSTSPITFGTDNTGGSTRYTWTVNGASVGIPASGEGNTVPAMMLTNNGTAPVTNSINVTPHFSNGGVECSGAVTSFDITVNPTIAASNISSQTVCAGSSVSAITLGSNYSGLTGNVSYLWSVTGANIGLTDGTTNSSIPSFTALNPSSSPVTATVTVTPILHNGGIDCEGTPSTFTITVNPSAQVNAVANQVVCNGGNVAAVDFSTNRTGGSTSYVWRMSSDIGQGTGNHNGNMPQFTAVNNGTAPVVVTVTVTPTFTNNGVSCQGTPETFTITVNPTAQVNDPDDLILCYGASTGSIVFTTNNSGGTTNYSWTNDNTAIGLAASGTGNISSFNAQNNTNAPIISNITVTPSFENASQECTGNAQSFTITVNPRAQVNDPSDIEICNGARVNQINFTTNNTGGTTSYRWTNNNTSIGLGASGTGNIPSFTATNTTSGIITATIRVTPSYRNSNGGEACDGPSEEFTITVYPTPHLTSSLTASLCSNNTFTYTPTSATTGVSFAWSRGALPTGVTATGATTGTGNISQLLRNVSHNAQNVTYTYTLSANGCSYSQDVVVTVNPEPVISEQAPAICSGQSFTWRILLDNFTNPADGITFTWPAPVTSEGVTGGTARTVPSSADISDIFINTTGASGTITYTVTPYNNGCVGEPYDIVVRVGSQPVLANLDMSACSNTAIGLVFDVQTGSSMADRYSVTNVQIDAGLTVITSSPTANDVGANYLSNDVYRNYTGSPLTVTYTVRPALGVDCVGDESDIVVTINPEPVIEPNQTASVCSDEPINYEILLATPNIPAGTVFNWDMPTISDGSIQGSAGVDVAADPAGTVHITDAITNRTGADITAIYRITPTSGNGCVGEAVNVVITIHPEPVTSAISGDNILCNNTINHLYAVDNHVNSTYTWGIPAGLDMRLNYNEYFIIVDAVAETAPDARIWVVETNTVTGCSGDTVYFHVTVVPEIVGVTVTGPAELCEGEIGTFSVPYNGGSTYTWSLPVGAIPVAGQNEHEIQVRFTSPVVGTVSVIESSSGSCATNHLPLTVTVNTLPIIYTMSAPPAYCEGSTGVTITLNGSETGVSYQLYRNDGTGAVAYGAPVDGTGNALTWDNCTTATYTVEATNSTTGCSRMMEGTVTPIVNAIDGGSIEAIQSICAGSDPVPFTSVAAIASGTISYQWYRSTDGFATSEMIPGATSAVYAPVSLTRDTYFWRMAYSTVTPTSYYSVGTSICEASSDTIYINVINFDAGTIGVEQTICSGSTAATFISVADASSTEDDPYLDYIYQWQMSTNGINYVDLTTPGATSAEYTHPYALTQNTWFRRRVTATCNNITGSASCTKESAAICVYVINFLPGSISGSQVIPYNGQPHAFSQISASGDGFFTYQWQDSIAGGVWQNVTAGTVTASGELYTPPQLTENTWYRRIATATMNSTTCQDTSNVVSVMVINFDPGTISADQTICVGDIPATMTGTLPTSLTTETYAFTYQWQSRTAGGSFVNISGATGQDYTPTTAANEDITYRRLVTAMYDNISYVLNTNDVTVTVNNFTIGSIRTVGTNALEQTICYNSDASAIEYTGTIYYEPDAVITLQWQYLNTSVAEWTSITGATTNTLSPTGLTEDTRYRLVVSSQLNGITCVQFTNEVLVVVVDMTAGSILDDQVICSGTQALTITGTPASGDGTFTYRWYRSTDNGVTFTQVAGNGETYSPGVLYDDASYYRVAVSNLNDACVATSNTITIVVNNVTGGTIGNEQTICEGDIPASLTTVASATADAATLAYQWYSSADGISFAPITVDGTNETYQPAALTQDTYYYREAISVVTLHTTGGDDISTSCSALSNTVRISVNNLGSNVLNTPDQTICLNSIPATIVGNNVSLDGGTPAYQWQISTDGSTFTDIVGANNAIYTETAALTQDTWYRRVVSSTYNGVVCSNISNVVMITVINFNPGTLTAPDAICEGGQPGDIIGTEPSPSTGYVYTYQWQRLVSGNWINISGATSANYTPATLTEDTQFRRMVTAMANGVLCTSYTDPVTVMVNNFVIGSISAEQNICMGSTMADLVYSGTGLNDGIETLQWQMSYSGNADEFTDIAGATSNTLSMSDTWNQDVWFRLRVTSTLGTAVCEQYTNTVHITVINFTPGVIGNDQYICSNTLANPLVMTTAPSGDGTFSFQWYESVVGPLNGFTPIAGATANTYNPGYLTSDHWYYLQVISDLNPTCSQNTNVVAIDVNSLTPGTIGADQIICSGDVPAPLTTATAATADGTLTYQWYSSTDGYLFYAISGAIEETYAPEALTQDMWYRRDVISTIYDGAAVASRCEVEGANVVRVYVNNIGINTVSGEQTVCVGTTVVINGNQVTGDGTISYQWQSMTSGGTWADIPGANSATYSAAVSVDTWFRRIVYSEYSVAGIAPVMCSDTSNEVQVTVINFNPGTITGDQAICNGSVITPLGGPSASATDGVSAYTFDYQWQYSTDGVNFYNVSGATDLTYTPSGLAQSTYFRRAVIANINGTMCEDYSNVVLVTVNNIQLGTLTGTQTLCETGTTTALNYSGTTSTGIVTLQWEYSGDGVNYVNLGASFAENGMSTLAATDTLTQDAWFRLRVESTVTDSHGSNITCELWTDPVVVTVINFNPGSIGSDQVICESDYAMPLTSVTPTGDGRFTYQWFEGTSANENDATPTIVWTAIPGGNSETWNPGRLTNDRWYYRAVTATVNGVSCVQNTNTVYVRVNNLDAGEISLESTNIVTEMTICDGTAAPTIYGTPVVADGTVTYNWLASSDGVNYVSLGVTTPDYTPASITEDTWFRRDVTSTVDSPVAYSCTTTSGIVRVTVINFQPGRISGTQTICEGTAPSRFTGTSASGDGIIAYQWQSSTDNINFVDIADSPTNSSVSAYYSSPALTQNTWFRRMATSTLNGTTCILYSDTIRVTVVVYDEGVIGSDQFVCEGTVPDPLTGTAATDSYPADNYRYYYQWQQRTASSDWINIVGATDPLQYVPTDPVYEDTWFRKVTTADVGGYQCVKYSNEVIVNVNNFVVGTISADQALCDGTTINPLVYSGTSNADGTITMEWQYLNSTVAVFTSTGVTTDTYTPTASIINNEDTRFRLAVTSNNGNISCTKYTNEVVIYINNFEVGSMSNDQVICENTAAQPIDVVVPASGDGVLSYRWYQSTTGESGSYVLIPGATASWYAPGILTQDAWYYREVTSTMIIGSGLSVSCSRNNIPVYIQVNNVDAGTITGEATVCEGTDGITVSSVSDFVHDGASSLQWYESNDGIVFTPIAGEQGISYTRSTPILNDMWYKLRVTSTIGSNICFDETDAIKVTVVNFEPGFIGPNQIICRNTQAATITGRAPTGDIENVYTYAWEFTLDTLGGTINTISGANGSTFNPGVLTQDTYFRRVVYAGQAGLMSGCPLYTNWVKVEIIDFTPGAIGSDQMICEGEIPALLTNETAAAGQGTFAYQWQMSYDNANFSNIVGATDATYQPEALMYDTYFRRLALATLGEVTCADTSNVVVVWVNNIFNAGMISGDQTICEGSTPNDALFAQTTAYGDGVISYRWYSRTEGTAYVYRADLGTGPLFTPEPLTEDTWYLREAVSLMSTGALSLECRRESGEIVITVNNFNPGSIAGDQTICEGSVAETLTSVTPTGDGRFSYQWYRSTTAEDSGYSMIVGATNETYYPGILTQDTWFRREVTSTLNGVACSAFSANTVLVTVINMNAGTIGSEETICSGTAPQNAITFIAGGEPELNGGTASYQWQESIDNINFTNISGAWGDSYLPGILTQDTWYRVIVTSTLNGESCTAISNSVLKRVNNVNGGSIISDQFICLGGDPVTFLSTSNGSGDGVITYRWEMSTDNVVFTPISGTNNPSYDPGALTQNTYFRRVTISTYDDVSCEALSNVVLVTVNEIYGGTIGYDQTLCYGETPMPLESVVDGTGSGIVTYRWYRSDNGIYFSFITTTGGAGDAEYAPGVHYADAWYYRETWSNLNGNTCMANSDTIHITVHPRPVGVLSGGATICPGESTILSVTLSVGAAPFEIDLLSSADGSIVSVTNYNSGDDIIVSPTATTTYTISRIRDANNCEVPFGAYSAGYMSGSATVTVRDLAAIVTQPIDNTLCEYGIANFQVVATGTDVQYQWYENGVPLSDGGFYYGATSASLSIYGVLRNMDGNNYYVEVSNCATTITSDMVMLNVNTVPEIQQHPQDTTICSTENAAFGVVANGTNLMYQWQINRNDGHGFQNVVDDAIFSGSDRDSLHLTNVPGMYNNNIFRVVITGDCGTATYSNFVVLRVNMPPVVTRNPVDAALCDGAGLVYFTAGGSGMIDSMRWQVSVDGITWEYLYDNAFYSGTTSQQLSLVDAPLSFNGYRYRLALKAFCSTVYSEPATLTVHDNPVVDFSSIDPMAACGGVAQILDASLYTTGGSTFTQHTWTGDVGPLNNYFVQAPTFLTSVSGDYTLVYRVTDAFGCYGYDTIQIVVDKPDASFTMNTLSGCSPADISFTMMDNTVASWRWDFGDGVINTTDANPTHTFVNTSSSAITYYNVKLVVESATGCLDSTTQMVTVYPASDASFYAETDSICSGDAMVFTGVSGASSYYWDYGDGISGNGSYSTSHVYINSTSAPMYVTVTLTTRSSYGCQSVETRSIVVMPVPTPDFNVAQIPPYVIDGAGISLDFVNVSGDGAWTYFWEFGDGATSTDENPSHTYTSYGDFTVRLTVSNGLCASTVEKIISIIPRAPIASFAEIPSGCGPLSIVTNNTSENVDIPGTTYLWDFGDGSFATSKNPTYTYNVAGTYRITLTVNGPGGRSIYSQVVDVYESPRAYFEVTPTSVFVNDESVRMFNLSMGADYYLWEFGDGDTTRVEEPFHKYLREGTYDITLWAYSNNGCSDRYILSPGVTVEPSGNLRFATVFRPSQDGPTTTTGTLGENTEITLPTGGEMIDRYFFPPIRAQVQTYKLQIFNRLGVLIFESDNINCPWDGYYKGQLCQQGVYVWYVEGKYANGEPYKQVGDITLLH